MKTRIIGYLLLLVAVLNFVIDILNGGGLNLSQHFDSLLAALNGAGLIFLRNAVAKIQTSTQE